jgi:hypothetical protein
MNHVRFGWTAVCRALMNAWRKANHRIGNGLLPGKSPAAERLEKGPGRIHFRGQGGSNGVRRGHAAQPEEIVTA